MTGHTQSITSHSKDWAWPYWLPVPIYPYGQRRTLRQEIIPDWIWTFDQVQGIFYVVVPIRMTVVRLEAGGLLVYAPVAPTPECLRLVQELVEQYGEVKYIILPTVSGLEHKVFVGPFARRFATAQVYIAPHQWSFPLNLPLRWLGFPMARVQILPEQSADAPFADEFDYAMLGPIQLGLGPFAEVAFYHRRSRSLLVTDSVLSVPNDPPAVVQLDPFPLLFHAKDSALDNPIDHPANRRKGWWRTALFAFYFQPSALAVPGLAELLREAVKAPDRSKKAYFGLFPFRWKANWQESFAALHRGGQLFVAPVLQALILNRAPEATLAWVDRVASWDFERILPCHLEAPIAASPEQFRRAFGFLQGQPDLPESDFEFLRELEETLVQRGVTPPIQS